MSFPDKSVKQNKILPLVTVKQISNKIVKSRFKTNLLTPEQIIHTN